MIVEVSDSTLNTDLVEKSKQYAEHAIADYWVADLQGDQVWVHRGATASGYSSVTTVQRGDTISPLAFPDVTFTADEILG